MIIQCLILTQVTSAILRAAITRNLSVLAFKSIIIRQLLASLDVRSGEENNVIFVVHLDNFGVHVGVATVVCKSSVVSLKRAVDDGVIVLF